MKKETFVKLINFAESFDKELDRWYDFGIELSEQPINNIFWDTFYCIIKDQFTECGKDWIDWYLFERISVITHKPLSIIGEDGEKIYINNPEELWELVEQHQLDYSVEEACDTKSDIA